HRRRLAATRRADEYHELSGGDVELERVDGLRPVCVHLRDFVENDLCHVPPRAGLPIPDPIQVRGLAAARVALDDAVRLAVVGEKLEEWVRRERLRAEDARSLPGAGCEQLERDH